MFFSVSPYQLIVKYVFGLLLVDCCMKLVFLLSVIFCLMPKNVSESTKNSIKRKHGSDDSHGCNGNNCSKGKNDPDKEMEAKASTAATAVPAGTAAMISTK